MQKGKFDMHIKDFFLFRNSTDEVEVIVEELSKITKDKEIKDFLDIGCGSGELTEEVIKRFKIKNATIIDKVVLDKKINKNVKFFKKDWLNFAYTKKFDFILSAHSMAYLSFKEAELSIKKIYDCLKDNGKAAIIIYDSKGNWPIFKSIFYPKFGLNKCTLDFIRPIISKYKYSEKIFFTRIYAKDLNGMMEIGRFLGEKHLVNYLKKSLKISDFFKKFQRDDGSIIFSLLHKLFVLYKK